MPLTFFVLIVFVVFNGQPLTATHVYSDKLECDRAATRARSQAGFEGISQVHVRCIETPAVKTSERAT
jgi:hypothetical protein